MDEIFADWFADHNEAEVMELFAEKNVVAGPVLDIGDIFKDPHYAARDDIVSVPDADFGQVKMQGVVPRFSETPGEVRHTGGALGQDNDAVLCGLLGLDAAQIEHLRSLKVV